MVLEHAATPSTDGPLARMRKRGFWVGTCVVLAVGIVLGMLLALVCGFLPPRHAPAVFCAFGGAATLVLLARLAQPRACAALRRLRAQRAVRAEERPVTQAVIEKIGVVCTNAQLQDVLVQKVPEACWTQCCVCLQAIKPHATVRGLSCGHAFHKKCIDDWFRVALAAEHLRCPLCRRSALVRPSLKGRPPSPPQVWRASLYSAVAERRWGASGSGPPQGQRVIHV